MRIILKHFGHNVSVQKIRELSELSRTGVSIKALSDAANHIGFETLATRLSFNQLATDALFPCIVHWNQNHFVVVYNITPKKVYVSDPGIGLIQYSHEEFKEMWYQTDSQLGIALMFEITEKVKNFKFEEATSNLSFIRKHFKKRTKTLVYLILTMFAVSLIQLAFPFLTQKIVDVGIRDKDIQFIYIILSAQLLLMLGKYTFEFIRDRILIFLSTYLNTDLIVEFLNKMMKLPFSFFDSKLTGDLIQRISDHGRIENFFNITSLNIVFSFLTVFVYSGVLLYYYPLVFIVFMIIGFFYILYTLFFLKKRKLLDYKKFQSLSDNQESLVQIIHGMAEIKINNWHEYKKAEWRRIQLKILDINVASLNLSQIQTGGGLFIREIGNIVITILSATAVIEGNITLGVMLAIQYIIGQLNIPLNNFVQFTKQIQDATLSLERINEIHSMKDESHKGDIEQIDINADIEFREVSFKYPGTNATVLNNLSFTIPYGKRTAIVGTSGSGKSTLLKLILRFYEPTAGEIRYGSNSLGHLEPNLWRSKCGAVMQDGFVFSDSFRNNITGSDDYNPKQLQKAIQGSNLSDFVSKMPLRENADVGSDGSGLSGGEKQRLLIARAIYKNPEIFLFDEATSSLDSYNENTIMNNINEHTEGKTVVIVAHRLSTVKNSDNIIVLNNGNIQESGTHEELIAKRGDYYFLIKNQLELGE